MIFRSHSTLTKIDASTLLKKILHVFQINVEIKTKDIKSTKAANDKTHNGCSVYKFPTGTENIKYPVAGEIFKNNSEHDIPHKVSVVYLLLFCKFKSKSKSKYLHEEKAPAVSSGQCRAKVTL